MADTLTFKPRDATATRARILAAASDAFIETGYAKTGLREIAARAGVASSLLIRYFGTKPALFEAALVATIEGNSVFTPDKEGFGERMAALIVARSNIRITAMLVLAQTDPELREAARRIGRSHVIGPLADWIGLPHALPRAFAMISLMSGFVVQMEGFAPDAVPPRSLDWLARSLQAIVDDRED